MWSSEMNLGQKLKKGLCLDFAFWCNNGVNNKSFTVEKEHYFTL